MADLRVLKLAKILVNYSIKIKKGDVILVSCGEEAKDLALEVCRLILKKGAIPRVRVGLPGFAYMYYKNASEKQLKHYPKIAEYEARNVAGSIGIGVEYNTKELTNIEPKKMAMRSKITYPISKIHIDRNNWVICEYPTNSLAQDAEMSLQEFEVFVYGACIQDWKKEAKRQNELKKILDKGRNVRIVGKDTDITFSIKGRKGIKCCGTRNMPDGEVFIAPVEKSTEGYISYSFPAIKGGREVDGIKLWFKKGKVVKATAKKNEKYLHKMLDIDKGAKYLGEFGIGTNYGIKKFVKQILFDEKIGGTIHLALGMAYKEGGGKNESALHWDMIKDLRKEGAIYIDNKCIQKNGRWRVKF